MWGSHSWFAALYAAAFLSAVLEQAENTVAEFSKVGATSFDPTAFPASLSGIYVLQFVRGVTVIGFGILFDMKGPRISMLAGSAACAGMWLCFIGGKHPILRVLGQILQTLVHPLCGLPALAARGCSHEERTSIIGRLFVARVAGGHAYGVNIPWMLSSGYLPLIMASMCPPMMLLQLYLTRRGSPGGPREDAELSPLPTPACTGSRLSLFKVLLRPELLSICGGLQLMLGLKTWKMFALGQAAGLGNIGQFLQILGDLVVLIPGIVIVTQSHLPSMAVRRYGPHRVMQGLLLMPILVDVPAMLLSSIVPQALMTSLEFSLVVGDVALLAAWQVTYVFALGVTEGSEHGTASSLLQVGDNGRHYHWLLSSILPELFMKGGIEATMAFFSMASLTLLVLFRRSPLLHVHFKEG